MFTVLVHAAGWRFEADWWSPWRLIARSFSNSSIRWSDVCSSSSS